MMLPPLIYLSECTEHEIRRMPSAFSPTWFTSPFLFDTLIVFPLDGYSITRWNAFVQ